MDASSNYALRRADDLIRSGKSEYAQQILIDLLRQNPRSEQGWLLLSLAVPDTNKQIDSLRMVLKINPNNSIARSRLTQLKMVADPSQRPPLKKQAVPEIEKNNLPPVEPAHESAQIEPKRSEFAEFQEAYNLLADTSDGLNPADPNKPFDKLPSEPSLIGHTSSPILNRVEEISAKSSRHPEIFTMAIGTGLVLLIVVVAMITMAGLKNYQQASIYNTQVVFQVTYQSQLVFLPPTWTPTPPLASTLTPTITPTIPPRPTATFPALAPSIAAQMDLLDQQVSDLRGLETTDNVHKYMVNRSSVKEALTSVLINHDKELSENAQVLTALGLIDPAYELDTYLLNGMLDNLGGVYLPWSKQILMLGLQSSGIENYVYSHEYDHAIVDQQFHIAEMGVYPCLGNTQRCDAIQALIEGDASLLMSQWAKTYASYQDYTDIKNYNPPPFLIPDQYSPPYVGMDLSFPYTYGTEFVQYLYKRGKWERVNKAYSELPESTEQIIHPEKYVNHEAPIVVSDPSLNDVLASDWHELRNDVLGEWMTYLILGYGADRSAQQKDAIASKAAAGWGGDTYQAYINEAEKEIILAVHWTWDTQADAKEFNKAMVDYLDKRFQGNQLDRENSDCWGTYGQVSCLIGDAADTVWIIAPDEAVTDEIVQLYASFINP